MPQGEFRKVPSDHLVGRMGLSDAQVLSDPAPLGSDSGGGPGSLQVFTFDNSVIDIAFLYHAVS